MLAKEFWKGIPELYIWIQNLKMQIERRSPRCKDYYIGRFLGLLYSVRESRGIDIYLIGRSEDTSYVNLLSLRVIY